MCLLKSGCLVVTVLLCLSLAAYAAEPDAMDPAATPAAVSAAVAETPAAEAPAAEPVVAAPAVAAPAAPVPAPSPVASPAPAPAPVAAVPPPAPVVDTRQVERERLAASMLDFFDAECAPLAAAKKESGMFGMFSSDENPVLGKCLDDLAEYVDTFWLLPDTARALQLRAQLFKAQKDAPAETAALAKLVYVFHDSPWRSKAENRLLGLAIEELKNDRPQLKLLAKGSDLPDRTERYFQFIQDFAKFEGAPFWKLLRSECDSFLQRFPGHPAAETVLAIKEDSFLREKRHELAASGYRRLVAVYPDSPLRAARLLALGGIYDDQLKQYERAVATFEQIIATYPEHGEALSAYQRAARIYDKNLEKYPKAVELLDQIVQRYPKNEAALRALQDEARIYAANIRNYYSAVKTYQRLADMFVGDAAVTGLVQAADLARNKIEDFELQVEIQNRLVDEYPQRNEAIEALYNSGETLEEKLHNPTQAMAAYQALVSAYPTHKLADKARKRIEKLSAKK